MVKIFKKIRIVKIILIIMPFRFAFNQIIIEVTFIQLIVTFIIVIITLLNIILLLLIIIILLISIIPLHILLILLLAHHPLLLTTINFHQTIAYTIITNIKVFIIRIIPKKNFNHSPLLLPLPLIINDCHDNPLLPLKINTN